MRCARPPARPAASPGCTAAPQMGGDRPERAGMSVDLDRERRLGRSVD